MEWNFKRKRNNKEKEKQQTNKRKQKQSKQTNKQKQQQPPKTRLIKTQNFRIKSNLAKLGELTGAIALFYLAIFLSICQISTQTDRIVNRADISRCRTNVIVWTSPPLIQKMRDMTSIPGVQRGRYSPFLTKIGASTRTAFIRANTCVSARLLPAVASRVRYALQIVHLSSV